jgi:hypothetical protein
MIKRNLVCTLIFLVLIMASCGSKTWDVAKFNMQPDILENGDEVVVGYASPGMAMPQSNSKFVQEFIKENNIDFAKDININDIPSTFEKGTKYSQLVAISLKTNDTINILTAYSYDNCSWEQYDGEEILVFSKTNDAKLKKVARDPKFDNIADNNYPTIIGKVSRYAQVYVDVKPKIKGGEKELINILYSNLKYPQEAIKMGVQQRIHVNFIVTKDGKVEKMKIIKTIENKTTVKSDDYQETVKLLEEEAIRLVKLTNEQWIPATKNGENVNCYYTLPVNFKLNGETN